MVLTSVRGWDNIPKDVKILSEKEALACQQNLIQTWEKPSEVFFLKYGSLISGLVTSISSLPIIHHFRKQFRLNRFGLVATYMPGSIMPAVLTVFGFNKLVTSEIVLMKMQCPLCMQFKYAAYHLCTSVFYTTLITALTCSSVALLKKTRYIPALQDDGKVFIKLFWDITRAGARRYQAITVFQLSIVMLLPYLQVREFNNLVKSAAEKEESMFNSQDSFSSEKLIE